MLLTVSFFVGFRVDISDNKVRSDIIIRSKLVCYRSETLDILGIFLLSNVQA